MKKSFLLALRLFKNHFARFFTILAIVFVSVGFMSGVGEADNTLRKKTNDVYALQNVSDLYLKSNKSAGFSANEILAIENRYGEENIMKSFCSEYLQSGRVTRLYSLNLNQNKINKLELLEGRLPKADFEVAVERKTKLFQSANIGDVLTINGKNYTVTGIVKNPFLMHKQREYSYTKSGRQVSQVVYAHSDNLTKINDVYVAFENRSLFNFLNDDYEAKINHEKASVTAKLGESNVRVVTLFENVGLQSVQVYTEMIGELCNVFVVFFLLITLLVVYSTMYRLMDEERNLIACQKTLGYSNLSIISRYVFFVFIASVIGGLLSFGVGLVLTRLIYDGVGVHYGLPEVGSTICYSYYLFTFAMIIVTTCLLTFLTGLKLASKKPSELLQHKMAEVKRKVFIERIPFIWNPLRFKYKSTTRNIFLFKSRFFMTVISIIGASVMVFAGLGLYDCVNENEGMDAIIAVAIMVIIFSAALSLLVICNITNINISERRREIATLMVLGYRNNAITGYIFREVYIMCLMGVILGLPCGRWFMLYVFDILGFGSLTQIGSWVWILSPIIIMVFTFFATLILRPKILNIDMNASLKSNE